MREQDHFAQEQPDDQPFSSGSQRLREKPLSSTLQRIGNYDLVRRIGIGGMGEVYLARQRTAFGREVAVKIIRPDLMHDITVRKRFLREAEVNAYLQHNHILPIIEFNEENGRLFLVTPYIKGGTLSKRLRGGKLSFVETHELFTALVEAVAYLHKNGVVHRDLKPSNILLQYEEGSERVYVRLIDFGIASLPGQPANAPLTTAGHEMGTAAYMAPERLNGIAAPSNDIYSLGIILYQMLTGKLPEDETDVMLPEPFEEVVLQSTASDPSKRYASAEELLKAFGHAHRSLSSSHLRVTGSNPALPAVGQNVSTHLPLVTPQSQASSLTSFVPMSDESPSRRPIANEQSGALSNLSSTPMVNSFSATNAQNNPRIARAFNPVPVQLSPVRLQNVVESAARTSQPLANLHAEMVLPELPGKTGSFKSEDYEAPTSYITPQKLQRSSTSSEYVSGTQKDEKEVSRPRKKKSGIPIVTIVSIVIIIIVFVIGSMAYSIYQASNIATVKITPQMQQVSAVFSLTAKPGQANVDSNAGTIPAQTLTSAQNTSSSSQTTGKTGGADCILLNVNCQPSVSQDDVENLAAQLRVTVKTKINQDIDQQEKARGGTGVGKIVYWNETDTANPPVGTTSTTVRVTVSMQGSQEYINTNDTRPVALQKLQGQLKPNYILIDTTTKIGSPVIQSVDKRGNVQIQIAAGAMSRYNITPSDISNIQKQIAGKTQQQALAILQGYANIDPKNISIRVSYGGDLPGSTGQITVTQVDPSTIPAVQLPSIP
jgi:serine/threonine protein kinase